MSRKSKLWITYLVLAAIAGVIVLAAVSFERQTHGPGAAQVVQYLSDGFFTAAVLYVGCSLLMYIQEAGNFYGIQFLFYTMAHLFSPRKSRAAERKTYYTYCLEKKERQAAEGKSPVKPAMLLMGIVCLALSLMFMEMFYRVQ